MVRQGTTGNLIDDRKLEVETVASASGLHTVFIRHAIDTNFGAKLNSRSFVCLPKDQTSHAVTPSFLFVMLCCDTSVTLL
jgi:hypothetical protein